MQRVLFLGSKRMGLRCLSAMHRTRPDSVVSIVTVDDRDDSRDAFDELQAFGRERGIPVTVCGSSADVDAAARAARPDLAIVCGWYRMIGADTLATAARGFVGVHNSLLPRYRGAAPLVWAMLNGETEVGLSMYTLTRGIDDGPVWAQARTTVGPDDYIGCVLGRLEDACETMVADAYPRLLDGTLQPAAQDASAATFGARRRPEDGRIDWRDGAERIYRFVRAQSSPYPGAFTTMGGQPLIIWRARPFAAPFYGRPGQVVRGPAGEQLVVCGDGRALQLEEVQLAGSGRGPAASLALGGRVILGE